MFKSAKLFSGLTSKKLELAKGSSMSKEMQEGVPQVKRSSRKFLKSAILVLGASAILQPAGAVFGNAQETPKKDGGSVHQTSKPGTKKPAVKPSSSKSKHKGGKKKEETPKKEG
jgi:hypothetical protein